MLKITINNEEVVSNKDFTIEEEMLNTSSVILNNVYPKSWENDKDYVSKFYHPNDYSKCLIKDEDYTPAEPGLNEEGTNFQVTADTTKLSELTSMKGNTTQSGTPTPTAPQPVNVVSGRQDVVVCGKNLLNEDEIVVGFLGTNGQWSPSVTSWSTTPYIPIEASTTYSFSFTPITTGTYWQTRVVYYDNTMAYVSGTDLSSYPSNYTYSITTPQNVSYMRISFTNTGNYQRKEFQLEKGTKTTYEAYNGNTYEINLGKNLFDKSKANLNKGVSTSTGGLYNSNTNFATDYTPITPGTYVVNGFSSSANRVYGAIYNSSKAYLSAISTAVGIKTFTITDTNVAYIRLTGLLDEIDTYQLEKGSQATSYAPYKTPIELCKIGNYQDRIYKNGNKWYIEKKIGKVVLNGSENWILRTDVSQTSGYYTFRNDSYVAGQLITNGTGYSNYFEIVSSGVSNRNNIRLINTSGYGTQICIEGTIAQTKEAFKTWLSTHNTSVYYVLSTPTTTEITDTELISQLNSIELLEGLNNVSVVSPYLQGIINIHYNYVNETTTSDLLFCGVVKNSGNISLNPRYPHYQTLQILDFKTFLSEGETLDFVIANKTIEEAIDQVVDTISPYGFIKGNIEILGADTIIGAYSTKDKTAYDVFNYLADITQSRWTTRLIDENTVAIDFYDPTLLPRGETIQYNETWFKNNLINDISYSYGSNDYRNKQVMTSKEVIGELEQVQIVYANGYQTQFMTEIKIAQINEIDVNGEPKTYATEDDKELGVEADFYYSIGNNIIESADTYPTGAVITIRYLPIVEGRQIITNNDEIDRVSTATGRKGVVARYEDRNDAITSNELQLIGQSYIRYKGVPEIKLNVQTRSNLWNIGDRVQFNAPITELATEYMVKKKTINRILANPDSEEHIVYTFELTSSFNSEQAINYFDNQRAKSKGNIGEGEAISRNIDIENETNIIFYDSNIVEITVVGDNVLNSTLNSPLNN